MKRTVSSSTNATNGGEKRFRNADGGKLGAAAAITTSTATARQNQDNNFSNSNFLHKSSSPRILQSTLLNSAAFNYQRGKFGANAFGGVYVYKWLLDWAEFEIDNA